MAGPRTNNDVRVWAFSVALVAIGLLSAVFALGVDTPQAPSVELPWWILVVAFATTERYVFNLDVRNQAVTLAFSEAPLTLGLILADPADVLVTRVVVGVAAIVLFRRSAVVKLVFNAGVFVLQAALALLVFDLVLAGASPVDPHGWLAALCASAASFLTSVVAIWAVMRLLGSRTPMRAQSLSILIGLSASLAASAVAVAAAVTLWRDGRAWALFVVIVAVIAVLGRSLLWFRDRYAQLSGINAYTVALVSNRDLGQLADGITAGIAELLQATRVVLLLPVEGRFRRHECREGECLAPVDHDLEPFEIDSLARIAGAPSVSWGPGSTVGGVVLEHPKVLVEPVSLPGRAGLLVVDGRRTEARDYDDSDRRLLTTAASQAATALENAQLVDRLRTEAAYRARQALHDDITDLVNSRGLQERLVGPLRDGQPIAVLTVRIASLREVNETLGRSTGDVLLRQVAKRLQAHAGPEWCAKSASDEFTLAIPGGASEAELLAGRILDAFEHPVLCDGVSLAITVGIGVALAPDHGDETDILLRRASLAASRARIEGARVTTWAVDRDPYDPQRLAIAADLRDAIPAGELTVHFQPQVEVASGLVTGAEALVRWHHPRLGELRPDQFIAAAEYTGAIEPLTLHVLELSARTCASWRSRGWDLEVGVNVSARNLASVSFAADVRAILDRVGLDPSAVTLELTESSIMNEAAPSLATLHQLHRLGVTLSIDDFGTGFSSLAHLRRLPVDEIKIDKSFVFDLITSRSDQAIVRSMIELGHNLGMSVVIEGVETPEVRRRLGDLRADRIQGYILSRPLTAPAFEAWIADRPVRSLEPGHGAASRLDVADEATLRATGSRRPAPPRHGDPEAGDN